jgi:hypothetical protein
VIVPLLAIPWPIVLFVTTTDAVTVTPLTVTALPGLTVPSLVTAPDTFAALTTIDVTVVLAGLSTLAALPVTDIPAAWAGNGVPRSSAATEVVARSAGMLEMPGAKRRREAAGNIAMRKAPDSEVRQFELESNDPNNSPVLCG